MAEYIDKEKAIEAIRLTYCKDCNSYNGVRCRACEFDDAMMEIEDCPIADVVEVVRCKDCKHNVANWKHDTYDATDYTDITCDYFMTDGMEATDFCSHGEKKEQE
jgi:hypothetical protein